MGGVHLRGATEGCTRPFFIGKHETHRFRVRCCPGSPLPQRWGVVMSAPSAICIDLLAHCTLCIVRLHRASCIGHCALFALCIICIMHCASCIVHHHHHHHHHRASCIMHRASCIMHSASCIVHRASFTRDTWDMLDCGGSHEWSRPEGCCLCVATGLQLLKLGDRSWSARSGEAVGSPTGSYMVHSSEVVWEDIGSVNQHVAVRSAAQCSAPRGAARHGGALFWTLEWCSSRHGAWSRFGDWMGF